MVDLAVEAGLLAAQLVVGPELVAWLLAAALV